MNKSFRIITILLSCFFVALISGCSDYNNTKNVTNSTSVQYSQPQLVDSVEVDSSASKEQRLSINMNIDRFDGFLNQIQGCNNNEAEGVISRLIELPFLNKGYDYYGPSTIETLNDWYYDTSKINMRLFDNEVFKITCHSNNGAIANVTFNFMSHRYDIDNDITESYKESLLKTISTVSDNLKQKYGEPQKQGIIGESLNGESIIWSGDLLPSGVKSITLYWITSIPDKDKREKGRIHGKLMIDFYDSITFLGCIDNQDLEYFSRQFSSFKGDMDTITNFMEEFVLRYYHFEKKTESYADKELPFERVTYTLLQNKDSKSNVFPYHLMGSGERIFYIIELDIYKDSLCMNLISNTNSYYYKKSVHSDLYSYTKDSVDYICNVSRDDSFEYGKINKENELSYYILDDYFGLFLSLAQGFSSNPYGKNNTVIDTRINGKYVDDTYWVNRFFNVDKETGYVKCSDEFESVFSHISWKNPEYVGNITKHLPEKISSIDIEMLDDKSGFKIGFMFNY